MKIAILGTRGIPNYYGGFEQCAEFLAVELANKGHEVIVYSSHNHPFKEDSWNGVELIHCYDPEDRLGTIGQFVYDLNCVLNLRKRQVDIILQLGYTSSSIWGWLLPKNAVVTTNMDGLEWKRTKYSKQVQKFLLWAERLAVKYSDHLIADSRGIQDYLKKKYAIDSQYIPYGADVIQRPNVDALKEYNLTEYDYSLLIARLEPENSIETILDGVTMSELKQTFLVIGKHNTKYGEYLKVKYNNFENIKFLGGIYDMNKLNSLRYFSNVYFHGHTVGGTNPSLLEAMASNCLICANDNPFNRYILEEDGLYFRSPVDVDVILRTTKKQHVNFQGMLIRNEEKLIATYSWDNIVNQYLTHFKAIIGNISRLQSRA